MKLKRFCWTILILGLGLAATWAVEPTKAEKQAFEETKTKAEAGDVNAQMELASLYQTGTGVKKDKTKAFKWHQKAADQGLARAQYQLGTDYGQGIGVKPDAEEAVRWFRKAADQGLLQAEVELGLCYLEGDGVKNSGVEAVRWLRKAAAQDFPPAEYHLGKCFLEGTGVAQDVQEGFKWLQAAADQGLAKAQEAVGDCYVKGDAVSKNPLQAYVWFNLAAAQDDESSADIRVKIAKVEGELSKEEILQGQQIARDFKPGKKSAPSPASASSSATPGEPALVSVSAMDENCEVYVDGSFVGNAPARLKLTPGKHVIEVKKSGFKDYRREVSVLSGSELNLRAELEAQ